MRNALRSDPFKLKVDGSNYMLVTHEKISKSSKGKCTGSGLFIFYIWDHNRTVLFQIGLRYSIEKIPDPVQLSL